MPGTAGAGEGKPPSTPPPAHWKLLSESVQHTCTVEGAGAGYESNVLLRLIVHQTRQCNQISDNVAII